MDHRHAIGIPTVRDVLAGHAASQPDAPAIVAISGTVLTFAGLVTEMQRTRASLRALGIGPQDRIATVLPDGPEAALAFLSIASSSVSAPLNPALRAMKLGFYLRDIPARAVLVQSGVGGEIVDVARALGIQVIELVPRGDGRGTFDLRSDGPVTGPPGPGNPRPDSVALVLHTSGTTSQPKLVPLTHQNLVSSALFTSAALELGPSDRALHVVPMFHIQGLVTSLLAPLAAGGAVVCAPGFQAFEFLDWLRTSNATWYTAVPTMHQAIVERARQVGARGHSGQLRFVRSSASPLAVQLAADLKEIFAAPVVDGYGMTEAAPIIASTPLSPNGSKPGSVGIAAGPDVTILDERGVALGAGQVGEIAVRGPNVMTGYEHDPEANAAAFVNGWFRTGDQGYLDEHGGLFLTGRLREIINRGGERIAPREIEEVLLQHPAVAEAVVFGVPDSRLGERVAAAIVRKQGASVTEHDLRQFVSGKLAFFKIPARVSFAEKLPTGPTGKPLRLGLAEHFGLVEDASAESPDPATDVAEIQRELAALWSAALGIEQVGLHDNFFVLGGDSISFVEILYRVSQRYGVDIPAQSVVQSPTIAGLCEKLRTTPKLVQDRAPMPPRANHRCAGTRAEREPTPTERRLAAIWKDLLLVEPESLQDNFFELGGEAVPIARLFERIRETFGLDLPVRALLESPTIERLARTIDAAMPASALLVPMQPSGSRTPVFAVHDGGGYFFYWGLASRIDPDRPFYTLQAECHLNGWSKPYATSPTIEHLAKRYIHAIQTAQPHGPYHLAGASFGGVVAFEMARQLRAAGHDVRSVFLISSFVRNNPYGTPGSSLESRPTRSPAGSGRLASRRMARRVIDALTANARGLVTDITWRWAAFRRRPIAPKLIHDRYLEASRGLIARYRPDRYDGRIVLLRGAGESDPAPNWEGLAAGVDVHTLPGRHMEMTRPPHVDELARIMRGQLDAAESTAAVGPAGSLAAAV